MARYADRDVGRGEDGKEADGDEVGKCCATEWGNDASWGMFLVIGSGDGVWIRRTSVDHHHERDAEEVK